MRASTEESWVNRQSGALAIVFGGVLGGITKLYLVGTPGRRGAIDGRPVLVLLVGTASRVWIEPLYIAPDVAPLGHLWAVVAADAADPVVVLDSCIAFFPEWFAPCPTLARVREQMQDLDVLDLTGAPRALPAGWAALRHEACDRFRELIVVEASLVPWAGDPYSSLDASGGS